MTRLKEGDQVIVLSGADSGKTGRLISINRSGGMAVVQGINMKWKHLRKSQENPQGARVEREYPIDLSNLAYLDAATGKGVRLGAKIEGGKKVRVMRPSGKTVES